MRTQWLFPIGIILQSLIASGVYAYNKDWRHSIYFLAGAVITASATF